MTPVPYATAMVEDDTVALVTDGNDDDSESDNGSDMDNDADVYLPRVYDIEKDEDLPDDSYDAKFMEEDGTYGIDHVWSYVDLTTELEPPSNMYNGVGPCLKRGIAEKLKNALDAVAICGGMDYNFLKRLTANSNQYAWSKLDDRKRFGGYPWNNIRTEEMHHFMEYY